MTSLHRVSNRPPSMARSPLPALVFGIALNVAVFGLMGWAPRQARSAAQQVAGIGLVTGTVPVRTPAQEVGLEARTKGLQRAQAEAGQVRVRIVEGAGTPVAALRLALPAQRR